MSQPSSPRGRGIEPVEGDPAAIERRGRTIKQLGDDAYQPEYPTPSMEPTSLRSGPWLT